MAVALYLLAALVLRHESPQGCKFKLFMRG